MRNRSRKQILSDKYPLQTKAVKRKFHVCFCFVFVPLVCFFMGKNSVLVIRGEKPDMERTGVYMNHFQAFCAGNTRLDILRTSSGSHVAGGAIRDTRNIIYMFFSL